MTAVTPHGTKVTGVAPIRTPRRCQAARAENRTARIGKAARIGCKPAQNRHADAKIQLARAVAAPPTRAIDRPTDWRGERRVRVA